MKARANPFPLVLLVLLLILAAWSLESNGENNNWGMAGVGVIALLTCGRLPVRIWEATAAILVIITVYTFNPTHYWTEGVGLLPVRHLSGVPGSAFPAGTLVAWGLTVAMLAAYALAFELTRNQIRGLQQIAIWTGAAMAMWVLEQRLEPKPFPVFERTGLFVNENHFAVFSNLILPVVLTTATRAHFRAVRDGRPSSPAGLYGLVVVLMGAAVVLSRSRAGVLVMALIVVVHAILYRHLVRRHPFLADSGHYWRKRLAGCVVVLVLISAAVMSIREWHHPDDIQREWAFRTTILRDTLSIWRAQPLWGTGLGTFPATYPYYQSGNLQHHVILHAHCEPAEFLSEFGWLGGLWMIGAAGLALSARKSQEPSSEIPPFTDLERQGFLMGLAACALHCCVDFPLRVPLMALIAAAWLGVWAGQRPEISIRQERRG